MTGSERGGTQKDQIRRAGRVGSGVTCIVSDVCQIPEIPQSAEPPAKARGGRGRIVGCDVQSDLRLTLRGLNEESIGTRARSSEGGIRIRASTR